VHVCIDDRVTSKRKTKFKGEVEPNCSQSEYRIIWIRVRERFLYALRTKIEEEGIGLLGALCPVEDETTKGDGVPKHLKRGNLRAKDQYRAADEENVLENSCECQDKAATGADEEDGCDVEAKGDGGIRDEDERADSVEVLEWCPAFGEGEDEKVNCCAHGGVVV